MSSPPVVIALLGPAGSGKTTVATHLVQNYGAQRFSLAAPLKLIAKRTLGFSDEQLYGTQEEKETIDPRYGFSARWFLQRLGTEGIRYVMGPDVWTKTCLDSIYRANPRLAVIDDTRFTDEAEMVQLDPRFNGFVWRLWPVNDITSAQRAALAGAHQSEAEWADAPASLEIRPKARGVPELLGMIDIAMGFVRDPSAGVRW